MSYSSTLRQMAVALGLAVAALLSGHAVAAPAISYAPFANTTQTTNRVLSATLVDGVGVATGGLAPRIYYRKNAGAYFSQACSLASGSVNNGAWNCTVINADVGGVVVTDVMSYFVIAQDTAASLVSNPAGAVATNVNTVTTPPTPASYTIVTVVPTTINVGPTETITSLTNAGGVFELINNGALAANTVVNITGNLAGELGTVALNQFVENGAGGYTLLIRPSGGPRTVTGSNTSALIRLNGADRVTIDGSTTGGTATGVGGNALLRELTIQNTNVGTNAVVIAVQSGAAGAQNNTLRNLNVLGQDPTTTLVGIALGGNTIGTIGTDNDNNRVENCSVRRAIFGIYSSGQSAANPNTGTVITMNDLSSTGTDRVRRVGIVVFNDDGVQITQNSVGGLDTNENADGVGIGLGTQGADTTVVTAGGVVTNALVARNRINGVSSQSTAGFSAVGIAVAGGVGGANVIVNNMISGVTSPATSPDLVAGIFVAGVAGSSTRLLFNSVSMTGNRGTVITQTPSYAVAITGTNPTVELKNNVFSTTQTSGGGANAKSYAIGMVSTTFTNLDANYNAYYSSGANAGFFRSGSLTAGAGTDYGSLAAWRAAISDDANSLQVDPLFVSATDLHLQATSTLIGAATPVAGVTVDFDGQTRAAAAPAIGADEILVSADLSITKTDGVTTVTAGGSTTYTIKASNAGPNTTGAIVTDTFPAACASVAWTCAGASGGTCTASSTGNISDGVQLPAGSSVTYTAVCNISPSAIGTLVNTATVAIDVGVTDPDTGNNSATDTNTIIPLTYVVTGAASPIAGGSVACTSPVNHGSTTTCAVTTNAGYALTSASSNTCTGSLAGSTYTTGAVTSACTVTAVFTLNSYVVTGTASPLAGGSVACTSPVNHGSTTSCIVTTNAGFALTNISGCGGASGTTSPYTTGTVTAACTVTATYVVVVNGACGSANTVPAAVAPAANLCADASTPTVTTTPSQFSWTCNGVNGGNPASCTAPRTFTVTPSVTGGNGTATGGGAIVHGSTGSVTITPNLGFFTLTPVGGTCGGSLTGTAFTTSTVTANCTVIASFTAAITPSVSVSNVLGGSVSCTPQATIGGASTCTVVSNAGYRLASISGCGGVATTALTYVTGPISSPCVVTAAFVQDPALVVPVSGGLWAGLLAAMLAIVSGVMLRRRNRAWY